MSSKTTATASPEAADTILIPKSPMSFVWFVSKPFWLYAAGVFFFVTLAQGLSLTAPYILKILVDELTDADSTSEILVIIEEWGVVYVLIMLAVYAGWRVSGLIGVRWLAWSKEYSFLQLHDYLTRHSHTYFTNRFAGSLSNKVGHASMGADNLIEQFTYHYYPSILSLIGTAIVFLVTNVMIGTVFVVLAVVLTALNLYLVKKRHPLVMAYAESQSALTGHGVDLLTNIAAARQYVRFPFERQRLRTHAQDRTKKDIARDYSQEMGLLINNAIVAVAVILIVFYLYQGIKAEQLTVGDVVLVLSLLWSTSYTLIFIGNMLNGFIRVYGEIEEGLAVVLEPHEVLDHPFSKELNAPKGSINWQNVNFEFGQNKVFNDFNLTIEPGQRVGLVGPSGAGKTTFVSLLLRQHDIQGGAIMIDGQNIAEVTQDSLREHIAVVPQEPLLFHRSIRENIAYGKLGATEEEIIEVAKKAQAHDFISALPDGYDTLVGERGVKLSGGQKQRVAIARAMLKDAPILVLDEATSALDSESEVAIQQALHELMAGKTVVAIAHRLSTLREMDRILVLENGRIVEDGSHDSLKDAGGTYSRLWAHQAGGFLVE